MALVEEALAVHLITLCQAIDIRGADGLGRTRAAYDLVRTVTTYVDKDRELEEDIAAVLGLIRSGALTTSVADELAADDIVAAGEEIVMPVAGR